MALELTGKLILLLPEQHGTGKNGPWVKQDFVIETDEQYPKKICFSAWGDKAQQVSALQQGNQVKVFFNAESREFNGKWYTDLRIWKLEQADMVRQNGQAQNKDFGMEPWTMADGAESSENDLPF